MRSWWDAEGYQRAFVWRLFLSLSWSCFPFSLTWASPCQKMVLTGQTPLSEQGPCSAAHSPALAAASAGENLHRSSPGGSSFNFHNRHYFKPGCMSSGSKGEGSPSLHPCLTLLGTLSSPRAFPMTLGLHALVALWPHRQVELGTQSWW